MADKLNISASSTPVLSGTNEWGLYDWVAWHQALVKQYNTSTVIIKKDGISQAKNEFADSILNIQFNKLISGFSSGTNTKFYNEVSSGDKKFDDGRKYFGMWPFTKPWAMVKMQEYNPAFTLSEIGHGALDFGAGILKIVKYSILGLGVVVLIVGSAYVYTSFKKTKAIATK